jgi:hypothetical protein
VSPQEAESDVEGDVEENGYTQVGSVVPVVKNKGAIRTRVRTRARAEALQGTRGNVIF